MSKLSTSIKFLCQVAALLLLPWLACACQLVTGDYDDEIESSAAPQYINVTISVSASNSPVTRANPTGGEYGDGTERGIDRENVINDITLIFYQDATGINTTSDDAKVLFVKKYAVRPFKESDLPSTHTHKTGEPLIAQGQEVLYTTGNQKLEETTLTVGQSYKVLVVANAVVNVTVGEKITDVREKVFNSVYTGTGIGTDASNFVMTSETDATVTLANPTLDTSDGENKMIYYFDCIHIERLAARIDYCTGLAEYSDVYGGYVYEVKKPGPAGNIDYYVVTKVTPFNLYSEPEYVFKRVQDSWSGTPSITYLGDESTTNYVVDPLTAGKDNTETTIRYDNRLSVDLASNTQVMATVHTDNAVTDHQGLNNIIIAYPRENTLLPTSLLKKYATGIIFEVDIIRDANTDHPKPKETKRYYHYLRHQGETLKANEYSFKARKLEANGRESYGDDNETFSVDGGPGVGPVVVPMRCGIVRNNIYRVSIESISNDDITLHIKVKKWDKFVHAPIYM